MLMVLDLFLFVSIATSRDMLKGTVTSSLLLVVVAMLLVVVVAMLAVVVVLAVAAKVADLATVGEIYIITPLVKVLLTFLR
jgi:hypothetical protein